MATVEKVTRVANPRRRRNSRRRKVNSAKTPRNSKGRFTRRVKVRRPRRRAANPAPRRRAVKRHRTTARRRTYRRNPARRRNPVLIELGAINPFTGNTKRRKKTVAKRRRRSRNPRRYRRHATAVTRVRRRHHRRNPRRTYRRRRNPVVAVTRRRRSYRRRRSMNSRMRRYSRRRNPAIFGRSSGKDLLMMVGGGLLGVAATKFLPSLIPSSITASLGSSPLMGVLLTTAGAFAAGWIARKVSREMGDAVLFGGLMQAGSVALTAFAPAAVAKQLALSGLGDIVPGYFTVPQNSVTNRAPMAMVAGGGGGMGSAIPKPFGRR